MVRTVVHGHVMQTTINLVRHVQRVQACRILIAAANHVQFQMVLGRKHILVHVIVQPVRRGRHRRLRVLVRPVVGHIHMVVVLRHHVIQTTMRRQQRRVRQ